MGCINVVMDRILGQQTYNLSSENISASSISNSNHTHTSRYHQQRSKTAGNMKHKNGRKAVDYSNKEIAEFRISSFYIKSRISILRLDNNYLRTLPYHIVAFKNLKELYLQHNDFEYIPSHIWSFKYLEVLDLSFNVISSLPSNVLPDLINLRTLNLGYNQLHQLPEDFKYLKNLKEIYLESNKFVQMPPSLLELPQLKTMQLNRNLISYLPKNLGKLQKLENLYLAENPIVSIHVDVVNFLSEIPFLEVPREIQMKLHIAMADKITSLILPTVPLK